MTSKEKAIELVAKMKMYQYPSDVEIVMAKASAHIAVDEIISACEYNNVEVWNQHWWNDVKKEIDLL